MGGRENDLGRAIIAAYPPHLPQCSLRPGLIRPFAAFLVGDFGSLQGMLDELVASCREHGRVWELAFALQLRAKAMNELMGPDEVMADVRESRELFTRVGDRWGIAEALSAEAETAGLHGDWPDAARCYREAIAIARELGAHQQVPELTVRLGEAVLNGGDTDRGRTPAALPASTTACAPDPAPRARSSTAGSTSPPCSATAANWPPPTRRWTSSSPRCAPAPRS